MLTGLEAAFIGGDARQLEVIRRLAELDAGVTLFGFDNWQHQDGGIRKRELTPHALATVDAVILPVVGTDENGKVESLFASEELVLDDAHFAGLPKTAVVFTGIAKPYLKQACAKHQIRLVELLERDDVAIYNSIPTAEGSIMMAIQHTDITIHGSVCMVLGLGRTGMTLARMLKGLGATVKAGVRKPEHFARALEMGCVPFYTDDVARHATDVDVLFNTVPDMIVTAQVIANLPHSAVIIDLASKPGGTDFRYAERRGVKAILAPSLPGIVAPKTAGRIIANCLVQMLSEHPKLRRE